MPARRSASLARRNPKRVDVPILLFASAALLAVGLALPALETRTLLFWKDEYSVLINVSRLSREDKHLAAAVLAGCAIVYPAAKIVILAFFWLFPFPHAWRFRAIRLLRLLGRWAMLDVFTVSTLILASLAIGPLDATPKIGLYCYAAGIIVLMFVSLMMDRLARVGRR